MANSFSCLGSVELRYASRSGILKETIHLTEIYDFSCNRSKSVSIKDVKQCCKQCHITLLLSHVKAIQYPLVSIVPNICTIVHIHFIFTQSVVFIKSSSPKMSSFNHPQVVQNLVGFDFLEVNCLVTHIFLNIFFCVQEEEVKSYGFWNGIRFE